MEIQTVKAKKLAQKLLEIYPEKFTSDFDANKKALVELTTLSSKQTRNMIAGYISGLKRRQTEK